jgi:hypothetical protein
MSHDPADRRGSLRRFCEQQDAEHSVTSRKPERYELNADKELIAACGFSVSCSERDGVQIGLRLSAGLSRGVKSNRDV